MILTITGPSGSGKSTVQKLLKKKYGAKDIISYTTRKRRPKEQDGKDYHFVSEEEFADIPMFESVTFADNSYGTAIKDLQAALNDDFNKLYVVIVDRAGMLNYKKLHSDRVFSMYLKTDPAFAAGNMANRDGKTKAKKRLKADVAQGLYNSKGFDCIIANGMDMTISSLAYQIMNFVQAMKCTHKMKMEEKFAA